MSVSTLAMPKAEYEGEVGYLRGLGKGFKPGPSWSVMDRQSIQTDVKSGLKRFYYCGHPWSFLQPLATVTLLKGTTTVSETPQFYASAVTVGSGGTGYAVGDTITCSGGTFSSACVLKVTTVAAGVITALSVSTQGNYSLPPPLGAATQASSSGAGTGATATLTFGSSALPASFGGVDGGARASLTNTNLLFLQWLPFSGIGKVIQANAELPNAVGITRIIAMEPLPVIPAGGMQQWQMRFFPQADQNYTLTFPYFMAQNYLLDPQQPYAYGGIEHHETILESCLAVAEARRNDADGLHNKEFQRLLALSIQIDRRREPTNFGQNYDRSDNVNWWERWNGHGWSNEGGLVTINGTLYN